MDAWCEALPGLEVPRLDHFNPPLWEWGHVGWFQTWWIERNRELGLGLRCNPSHQRLGSHLPDADALYDSGAVAHARRWELRLPGVEATREELGRGLARTLHALEQAADGGGDLYFWQLVLAHEDMHAEASIGMAQALGIALPSAWTTGHCASPVPAPAQRSTLTIPAQRFMLGHDATDGVFGFDNEMVGHACELQAFEIDNRPVSWADYLEFVVETGHRLPRGLNHGPAGWSWQRLGRHEPLDLGQPAALISAADAQAWCDWAGRALPTEAQWECAARRHPGFAWGCVWEWTASAFEPYPGFSPHPYRDYSQPWFGSHRVLRGASLHTAQRLVSPSFRNFFLPDRDDLMAGFRTVACARR